MPFDEEIDVSCVMLTAAKNPQFFPKKYRIEVFVDGEWSTVVNSGVVKNISGYETIVHNFDTVKTSKIRIIADGLNSNNGEYRMELAELLAFSKNKVLD